MLIHISLEIIEMLLWQCLKFNLDIVLIICACYEYECPAMCSITGTLLKLWFVIFFLFFVYIYKNIQIYIKIQKKNTFVGDVDLYVEDLNSLKANWWPYKLICKEFRGQNSFKKPSLYILLALLNLLLAVLKNSRTILRYLHTISVKQICMKLDFFLIV